MATDTTPLSFDAATHTYRDANGEVYRSVTQRLSDFSIFKTMVVSAERRSEWDKAADEGRRLHTSIENAINGKPVQDESVEFKQWLAWRERFQPEFLACEKMVWHAPTKTAGTIDAIMKLDGETYIVDWKRTDKLTGPTSTNKTATPFGPIRDGNYAQYEMQLSMYAYMWQKLTGQKLDGGFLVACHPNLPEAQTWEVELRTDVSDAWFENPNVKP